MRWKLGRRSENVEDRREEGYSGGGGGINLGGKPLLMVAVVVIGLMMGQNPLQLLSILSALGGGSLLTGGGQTQQPHVNTPESNEQADFVRAILGSTEDTWAALLSRSNVRYHPPGLVLFSDQVDSACGLNSAATGPFYCPGDQKVYIDLSFFDTLSQLGAPGDFARAYVIGHEVGHHIQNLLGVSNQVHQLQQRSSQADGNALSVRLELQADCYAGVWANYANKQYQWMDAGDVEAGLQAASSIGDDRLQRQAGHRVSPESFTHGSAEQRVGWLSKGLKTGDINTCNTFGG